jgi:hypothetical protein
VTPCDVEVGYNVSEVQAVSIIKMNSRWRQYGPLKRCYPATTLHGVTIQKTLTSVFTAVKTSNLVSACYFLFPGYDYVCEEGTLFIRNPLYLRNVQRVYPPSF